MVRPDDRPDCVRVFQFMRAHQAGFPMATMARVLSVSTPGCDAGARRAPSARATADAVVLKRLRTMPATSHATDGAPRRHAELRAEGQQHGKQRIARLMRLAGRIGVSRRGQGVTTRRTKDARPAPDRVERHCTAAAANQLWGAAITLILSANSMCTIRSQR